MALRIACAAGKSLKSIPSPAAPRRARTARAAGASGPIFPRARIGETQGGAGAPHGPPRRPGQSGRYRGHERVHRGSVPGFQDRFRGGWRHRGGNAIVLRRDIDTGGARAQGRAGADESRRGHGPGSPRGAGP